MLNDPDAVTHTLFGQEILVNGYFTSVLGAPALNMGVFVGIISGFAGGVIYNRYYNFRKLPDALAFFNGKRFVPMVCIAWSVIISLVLAVIWPVYSLALTRLVCGSRILLPHPQSWPRLSTEPWSVCCCRLACTIC